MGVLDSLQQVISRRVIDREWFPTANRPGFHVIRPDSHWFLEQFVPFDYSSQPWSPMGRDAQSPSSAGRWGDWRRAPATWEPYHPAHDDHQVRGACRRWIARCLNVGTRFRLLTERDVRQAFAEAREGKPVVLAFTNHDHRDIRPDVDAVRAMLSSVSTEFPDVPFRFAEAVDAMRSALQLPFAPACDLDVRLGSVDGGGHVLEVRTETPTFGPQPWLAIKTRTGGYHHDNFDTEIPHHEWRYVFDGDTFPLEALEAVGVAANNSYGTATVRVLYPETERVTTRLWGA